MNLLYCGFYCRNNFSGNELQNKTIFKRITEALQAGRQCSFYSMQYISICYLNLLPA